MSRNAPQCQVFPSPPVDLDRSKPLISLVPFDLHFHCFKDNLLVSLVVSAIDYRVGCCISPTGPLLGGLKMRNQCLHF